MNLAIHDRFGEVDLEQRQLHHTQSVSPEAFLEHAKGKTLEQLGSEDKPRKIDLGFLNRTLMEPDPKFRYVQDPTDPGGVIDMTHFMEAAQFPLGLGELFGAGLEIDQARRGYPSAYEREDYKSNFLGVVFKNNYYKEDGDLSQQFQEFFDDLEKGELKGWMPAMERQLEFGIDKAKDTKRALQQLKGQIKQYLKRLTNPQKLQNLLDRLISFADPPAYAQDVQNRLNQAGIIDPLILDLDGDGIELTSLESDLIRFDIDGDGFREATGWVQPDDGFLVLDRNGDGFINDITELFGNQTTSGFVLLRVFDLNADGYIDINDAVFTNLQVWRDLDSDGRSDVNELYTLSELNISRIHAIANPTNILNAGNQIAETTFFKLTDGTKREIVSAWFSVDQLNSYYDFRSTLNEQVIFTPEILSLPNLRGYGNLPDLQIAMATDEQLLSLVKDFVEKFLQNPIEAGELINSILWRWAGVENINPTSRGNNVNAQELRFLEKFVGRFFRENSASIPIQEAGTMLSQSYSQLAGALKARLIAQIAFGSVTYDLLSDRLVFNGEVTQALAQFEQALNSSSQQSQLEAIALRQYIMEQPLAASWQLGTQNSEQLTGSSDSEELYGFMGNDTLSGNKGNDSLSGGSGNDLLEGGSGNDTYYYHRENGSDSIVDVHYEYSSYGQIVRWDGGNDTLIFGSGIIRSQLKWNFDGVDLIFTLTDDSSSGVTISNHLDYRYRIENFVVEGESISLSQIMSSVVHTDVRGVNQLYWDGMAINFDGGSGNDLIRITTGGYNDTLAGGEGDDTLSAIYGNDVLSGGEGNDLLDGGDGDDTLTGDSGDDTLIGRDGNDVLSGGEGFDLLEGGSGNDTYTYQRGHGSDTIIDVYHEYNYYGQIIPFNGGNDTLIFGAGISQNQLKWNFDGVDLIFTLTDDSSSGVTISNHVDYRYRIENFVVEGESISLSQIMSSVVHTDVRGVNQLHWDGMAINFDGGSGNDLIRITTGGYNDTLAGGEGDDSLSAIYGNDVLSGGEGKDLLDGGDGDDTLSGGSGDDTLIGRDGNDVLPGGEGFDLLEGGSGNDTYTYQRGHGSDTIVDANYGYNSYGQIVPWNGGNDTLVFGAGISQNQLKWSFDGVDLSFTLTNDPTSRVTISNHVDYRYRIENFVVEGESISLSQIMSSVVHTDVRGVNQLYWDATAINFDGGSGNDLLTTGNSNDTLTGGSGNDTINANYGNDVLNGGSGNDLLDGGDGLDILTGGGGSDTIKGGYSNDVLNGGSGNDLLDGGDGLDTLTGGSGNDTLMGSSGNHILVGGEGLDLLTGGGGADYFLYNAKTSSSSKTNGLMSITDFTSGTDKIVLSLTTFTGLMSASGNGFSIESEFTQVTSNAAAATSKAIIVYNSVNGHLFYNPNGVTAGLGDGGQVSSLTNTPFLEVSDFILQTT